MIWTIVSSPGADLTLTPCAPPGRDRSTPPHTGLHVEAADGMLRRVWRLPQGGPPSSTSALPTAWSPMPGSAGRPSAAMPSSTDRKSTRLNSSHLVSSYAVFCLPPHARGVFGLGWVWGGVVPLDGGLFSLLP